MSMNDYQTFVAKSRYCRYLDNQQRREDWPETVERAMKFLFNAEVPGQTVETIQKAITDHEVMPSMRLLMSAGEAAKRSNVAAYNCAYLTVDDYRAFDEAMYILLCGTGVGFSIEQRYVNKLQEVPEQLFESETTVVVSDSKEGWAKALRQIISLLYAGEVPKWDTRKVRPAGARLKVFGGRASGPEPLIDLFKFVVAKFKAAKGRKLSSLECHDIMCKIGDVVVVGGVRRSAMISLSDLDDDRMRHAKSGDWWTHNGQRALANNSAVYDGRPDTGVFLREWSSLYDSHSGERGIFNRRASIEAVKRVGRRNPDYEFGTNPCSEIILRPNQFCNLSEVVVRADDTVTELVTKVRLATILGTYQSTLTNFPYLRPIWRKNTEEERLLGVSLTGICDNALLNNPDDPALPALLEKLKQVAIDTNKEYAALLGIPQSAAITCVKPSGTVSQLVDAASGIHPRHAPYYIRRVRSDNKDPITQFMKSQGIPAEPDFMKPEQTTVFSFPMKAPEGALTRDDLGAIQHLKLWLVYQKHWCEHKPSVTINVREEEWPEVGAFVYQHFDDISGVSFLPHDGGSYRQAPYEEIDLAAYQALLDDMPSEVRWEEFVEFDDNVEGAQQLACVSGVCEI